MRNCCRRGAAVVIGVLAAALAACSSGQGPSPTGSGSGGPPATSDASSEPPEEPAETDPTPSGETGLVVVPDVEVEVADVATGLDAPWGLAGLPDGTLLVSLRDERGLVVVDPDSGEIQDVGGPGADELRDETVTGGESGLLGVAVGPEGGDGAGEVFVYRTAADGNEVLRGTLDGTGLSELDVVLDGIPAAQFHDGGRLAFGPDGFLYVATGDATQDGTSQDPGSLGGKILRITVDGEPAPDNPEPGSPVWSLGHRNVQGIAWDPTGRMLASEFGQNTWDELNVVEPGGNYGWPDVEGSGGQADGFVDPVAIWGTDDASPSGLAATREGAYLAGLGGERLWRVPFASPDGGSSADAFGEPQVVVEDLGRLRAVLVDPAVEQGEDGSSALYVLTNNTDGRGEPRSGDDRLVRVAISPAS
ncbi:PQQ-dependent sugar dehydrogenase [Cellulosimicrobium arenosum]|uniref:PQQ-dependent sugar dehydrogenase n=2 Tax=Cellulosimicrobium arenosum TaxID=2708133 RepID=A0A927IZ18_9MICO|nr:PQQ-dependent sugar dehydrogenase [Cellulosimicrobium arenosum]MBD8078996.1 PQQ-dependent sugar dehydrogenase [Cellulosimicrobium arenosum]